MNMKSGSRVDNRFLNIAMPEVTDHEVAGSQRFHARRVPGVPSSAPANRGVPGFVAGTLTMSESVHRLPPG